MDLFSGKEGIAGTTLALIVGLALAIVAFGIVSFHLMSAPQNNPAGSSGVSSGTPATPAAASSDLVVATSSPVSMNPASGTIGTSITIKGNGFGATNTVKINGLVAAGLRNLVSADGKTLRFKMPGTLGPECDPGRACPQFLVKVTPGPYAVSVVSGGTVLNAGIFTVTDGSGATDLNPPPAAPAPSADSGGKLPSGLQGYY